MRSKPLGEERSLDKHRVFTEVWTVGDPAIPITQQFSSAQSRLQLPE